MSARASRGSTGTLAITRPRAVARPSSVVAPSSRSVCRAVARACSGGWSSRARSRTSSLPQQAASSANAVRSAVAISGSGWSARRACSSFDQQRSTAPGPRRPARPARCSAAALLTATVTSDESPRRWSVRGSREKPASTTTRTPGTVSDDSATAVETTTRRRGPSLSARSCSAPGRRPCRGRTSASTSCSRRMVASTSATPGTKTSTSPSCSASARRTVEATWSWKAGVMPRSSVRRTPGGAEDHMDCTGCRAPGTSTTGAGSSTEASNPAVRSASTVADIAMRTRSSRRLARTSTSSARVRSASRWRSCTSSSTTAPTPASSGSCWMRRSRSPVVTTSTRVRRLVFRSPRTAYPTVSPTGSPSRCASRRAAARAAIRLGCVTTTRPSTATATAGGTSVVLPVPGGAWTTATPRPRTASPSAASPATTGRSGGAARRLWSGSGTCAVCLRGAAAISKDCKASDLSSESLLCGQALPLARSTCSLLPAQFFLSVEVGMLTVCRAHLLPRPPDTQLLMPTPSRRLLKRGCRGSRNRQRLKFVRRQRAAIPSLRHCLLGFCISREKPAGERRSHSQRLRCGEGFHRRPDMSLAR